MEAIDQKFDNWVSIWGSRKLGFNWGNEKCVEVRWGCDGGEMVPVTMMVDRCLGINKKF